MTGSHYTAARHSIPYCTGIAGRQVPGDGSFVSCRTVVESKQSVDLRLWGCLSTFHTLCDPEIEDGHMGRNG